METPLPTQEVSGKKQLISISDLFLGSWNMLVSHFSLFAGILVPAFAVSILLTFFPLTFWLILLESAVWAVATLALLYAIKDRDHGITIVSALRKGMRGFIGYIWLIVMYIFIVWGGFMLFVLPGILLGIWFYFASYLFVDGRVKGLNALLHSKDLVSGYTWQVFVRLLVPTLIWFAVIIPVFIILEATGLGRPLTNVDPDIAKHSFYVGDIVVDSISLLPTIFFSIFGFILFENIKQVRKELSFEIPNKTRKFKYIAVGLGGVFVSILIFFAVVLFLIMSLAIQVA